LKIEKYYEGTNPCQRHTLSGKQNGDRIQKLLRNGCVTKNLINKIEAGSGSEYWLCNENKIQGDEG